MRYNVMNADFMGGERDERDEDRERKAQGTRRNGESQPESRMGDNERDERESESGEY